MTAHITVTAYGKRTVVECPGSTSIRYVAKRAADELGFDADAYEFGLLRAHGTYVPMDDIAADHDGKTYYLLVVRT